MISRLFNPRSLSRNFSFAYNPLKVQSFAYSTKTKMSSQQQLNKAQRIVRFIAQDGQIYYGDAILDSNQSDARFAKKAKIITGDVLGDYKVTDSIVPIRKLLSPLPADKIPTARFLGLNYKKHAEESKMPIPKYPILFYKPVTAVSGPEDPIPVPTLAQQDNQTDYECEVVVVIGKQCRDVSQADALNYVLGYSVGNDVSQRSWQIQKGGGQWSLGKMFDGWAPFGPAIVTTDVIPDPQQLTISTKINGQTVQKESTSDMIFSVAYAVSFLSQGSTLQPGDLIFMGTPSGVGMGRTPKYWLQDGDVCDIELSGVGSIRNVVEYEKGSAKAKL